MVFNKKTGSILMLQNIFKAADSIKKHKMINGKVIGICYIYIQGGHN